MASSPSRATMAEVVSSIQRRSSALGTRPPAWRAVRQAPSSRAASAADAGGGAQVGELFEGEQRRLAEAHLDRRHEGSVGVLFGLIWLAGGPAQARPLERDVGARSTAPRWRSPRPPGRGSAAAAAKSPLRRSTAARTRTPNPAMNGTPPSSPAVMHRRAATAAASSSSTEERTYARAAAMVASVSQAGPAGETFLGGGELTERLGRAAVVGETRSRGSRWLQRRRCSLPSGGRRPVRPGPRRPRRQGRRRRGRSGPGRCRQSRDATRCPAAPRSGGRHRSRRRRRRGCHGRDGRTRG